MGDENIRWLLGIGVDELNAVQMSARAVVVFIASLILVRLDDLDQVHTARLERNGNVSIIPAKGQAKVVEVNVADGVQTVRIEIC